MIKHEDFLNEMSKLVGRFDKKYYPSEVVELLWREVKDLDIFWLKKTVALFLGQHKPALLPEFRENARIEKDRKRNSSVQSSNSDFQTILSPKQTKFMWAFTHAVADQRIKDQRKYLDFILPVMDKAFTEKDLKTLHELFLDMSKHSGIDYSIDVPNDVA